MFCGEAGGGAHMCTHTLENGTTLSPSIPLLNSKLREGNNGECESPHPLYVSPLQDLNRGSWNKEQAHALTWV